MSSTQTFFTTPPSINQYTRLVYEVSGEQWVASFGAFTHTSFGTLIPLPPHLLVKPHHLPYSHTMSALLLTLIVEVFFFTKLSVSSPTYHIPCFTVPVHYTILTLYTRE